MRAASRTRHAASWWPRRRSRAARWRRHRPAGRSATRRCAGRGQAGSRRTGAGPPATTPAPCGHPFVRRTPRRRPGCARQSLRPRRSIFQTHSQFAEFRFRDGEVHADGRHISTTVNYPILARRIGIGLFRRRPVRPLPANCSGRLDSGRRRLDHDSRHPALAAIISVTDWAADRFGTKRLFMTPVLASPPAPYGAHRRQLCCCSFYFVCRRNWAAACCSRREL